MTILMEAERCLPLVQRYVAAAGVFKVRSTGSEFTLRAAGDHALLNNERELSSDSLEENATISTK